MRRTKPMHHSVKADEVWFDHYASGRKPWSMRKNERDYKAGDTFTVYEWNGYTPTGREAGPFRITVVRSHLSWLPGGHSMLSLTELEES